MARQFAEKNGYSLSWRYQEDKPFNNAIVASQSGSGELFELELFFENAGDCLTIEESCILTHEYTNLDSFAFRQSHSCYDPENDTTYYILEFAARNTPGNPVDDFIVIFHSTISSPDSIKSATFRAIGKGEPFWMSKLEHSQWDAWSMIFT